MAIGTTIRRLRKERGLTLNQMAALIESDVGNLSRLERGVQGYSDAVLKKVASALGVPVSALFVDEDEVSFGLPPGTFQRVDVEGDSDADFIKIPMVKLRLQAGVTGFQTEPDRRDGGTLSMRRHWMDRSGFNPARLIAIQVRGDSMEPTLYEDDIVVINTADTVKQDGAVYAFNYEGEAVVKRLSRDGGMWWLTSDSPDQRKHHRKSCQNNDCIIVGRVVRRESDRI